MKIRGGYKQRRFKYKGFVFLLQRDSEGAGWYCDMAWREKDNRVVSTNYWTSGDAHYYTLSTILAGIKKEIDLKQYIVEQNTYTFR